MAGARGGAAGPARPHPPLPLPTEQEELKLPPGPRD